MIFSRVYFITEFNSTLLTGKVLQPNIIGYTGLSSNIVRLYRRYKILALGILVSDTIAITAAHPINDLPRPVCGEAHVLIDAINNAQFGFIRFYEIHYVIINSYNRSYLG